MNQTANQWVDYTCLTAGDGMKLERWGNITLLRPDPQAVWPMPKHHHQIDAIYHRSKSGGGQWEFIRPLPEYWTINYRQLTFKVAPTGFKHTGLFPEQAANWDFMIDKINHSNLKEIRILNLFAYTGGATMACASTKATEIVHVDAAKGMVDWAKENMQLCGLTDKTIRFIVDDCLKFIAREQRRGRTYHGIIMDPPSFGRGPNGEVWKFEDQLNELVNQASKLLDRDAIFFLVNAYTTGISSTVLKNLLTLTFQKHNLIGTVEAGEMQLPIADDQLLLPCGIYGRWSL
jgi:23S rRNA (cytosine1962-C5)-methyltransferase